MATKSSQSRLMRLKLLLVYVTCYCLSAAISKHSSWTPSSSSFLVQALVYHKYQPPAPTPLLSRYNRQPANISASDSYYNNYQAPTTYTRQQQVTYSTSSDSNDDQQGPSSYGCPAECHCNTIAHIADCSDRNLTRVPTRFPKDIKRIRLERNNITEIGPYAFQGLNRLQRIDLSNNNLYKIDALAFSGGLQALNTLILFNNKLEYLPANVFSELSNLQILLLNANSLQTIQKDLFQSLTNLYLLSLYDNNIVTLASGTFDALKSVKTIHLGKNPLNCDCNLRWLVDYFGTNPTIETSEARCEQPARSQGKRLSQLDKTELKCQEASPATSNTGGKGLYGDQLGACPDGCICTSTTVDCSRVEPGVESLGAAAATKPPLVAGKYEVPDVPDDVPVYVARVHINDNRIKRIRQTGLFKKLINSQKLDLGNNKIVDVEDNAINGRLPNGQKPERVIFVLLENEHCENRNTSSNNNNGQAIDTLTSSASTKSAAEIRQQSTSNNNEDQTRDACTLAPKVNEPQFDSACYNGGQCKPSAPSSQSPLSSSSSLFALNFTCQCPVGFGGPLCELNIDDCVDHQCQNGAMCVDGINSYKCICRDPTTSGEFCEQLSGNSLPFETSSGAASNRPFGSTTSNLIAPLALPIIAQASLNSIGSQSNELTVGMQTHQQQQQQLRAAQQPQILARSADFLRQPDELATNSLHTHQASTSSSSSAPPAKSSGRSQAQAQSKPCHRITTSRYFDDGNGCQSVRLLKINECVGSCESDVSGATCCVPTKIKRRRIHMQCGDGASYVKVVDLVKKCSCSQRESSGSCPAKTSEQAVALTRLVLGANNKMSNVSPLSASMARQQSSKYTTDLLNDGADQLTLARKSQAADHRSQSQTDQSGGGGESAGQEDQMFQITRLDAVE